MNKSNVSILESFEQNKIKLIDISNELLKFHSDSGSVIINDTYKSNLQYFSNNEFKIAVMGEQKKGKSSLINALIGKKILPEGVIPISNSIVEIKYGEKESAIVTFLNNKKEQYIKLTDLAEYCSEKKNPDNEKCVDKIYISYPCDLIKNSVTLVDTPGDNSINSYHTQIIYNYIPEASIVIFLSSDSPLSGSEFKFIKEKLAETDIDKIFFVLGKKDKFSDDQLEQIKTHNEDNIRKLGLKNMSDRFIPVSSKHYIDGITNNDSEKIEKSNIIKLKEVINEYISKNSSDIIIEKFVKESIYFINKMIKEQENTIKYYNDDKIKIEQKIHDLEITKINYEKKFEECLNKFKFVINEAKEDIIEKSNKLRTNSIKEIESKIESLSILNINDNIKIIPTQIEEFMMISYKNILQDNETYIIKPGLEILNKDIQSISKELEDKIMKLSSFNHSFELGDKVALASVGGIISSLAIYLGATLTTATTTFATTTAVTSPWIAWATFGWLGSTTISTPVVTHTLAYSWLGPIGIAAALSTLIITAIKVNSDFNNVITNFKKALTDQSDRFIFSYGSSPI